VCNIPIIGNECLPFNDTSRHKRNSVLISNEQQRQNDTYVTKRKASNIAFLIGRSDMKFLIVIIVISEL